MNNEKFKVNEYQVIFYDQPNPKRLQFLALNPLELDISVYNTPRQTPEKHAALEQILHYSHQLNGSDRGSISTDLEKVLIQVCICIPFTLCLCVSNMRMLDQFFLFSRTRHATVTIQA